ncbi:hypothetical protein Hanom_Chr14g01330621 [Helianthus anomalus]
MSAGILYPYRASEVITSGRNQAMTFIILFCHGDLLASSISDSQASKVYFCISTLNLIDGELLEKVNPVTGLKVKYFISTK